MIRIRKQPSIIRISCPLFDLVDINSPPTQLRLDEVCTGYIFIAPTIGKNSSLDESDGIWLQLADQLDGGN